jgi:hypothetical protein
LQLRLFQTMGEIAINQNSTIILPIPIDLLRPYLDLSDGSGDGYARKSSQERREEEEEAERMYEEAVGEVPREETPGELPRDGERP